MSSSLPLDNNSSRRDWRGLLLIFIALLIYLGGPSWNHLDKKAKISKEVSWDNLVTQIGSDFDCGIDPRRAIFLMEPIDINYADAEVLSSLKGIGAELATRIIAYRNLNGSFDQVSELTDVYGIGSKKLVGFGNNVTVGKCTD